MGRITTSELPAHSHSASMGSAGGHSHGITISAQQSAGGGYHIRKTDSPTTETWNTDWAGNHTHSISIGNTGGNSAHNIMQPYQVVYRWRRTA
ncbi:phage baseplate protein [Dialister succinatiphilus]|uniref:phage baseplate protein n=1 Tax=Dialister succinatiphilus TaxID=487173 RepID=UPI0040259476